MSNDLKHAAVSALHPHMAAEAFGRITGWTERSNEHERDAAMVAWPYRNARPA